MLRAIRYRAELPILVMAILLAGATLAFAQDPPDIAIGLNAQTLYYGGDFDSVDTTTGRLSLHIPLLSDNSERGRLSALYYLSYMSPGGFNGTCRTDVCYYVAPKYGVTGVATASAGLPAENFGVISVNNEPAGYLYEYYVQDLDGATHTVGNLTTGINGYLTYPYESIDGSGISVTADSSDLPLITDRKGNQFRNNYPSPDYFQDPNGNQISSPLDASTATDTLGRSWTYTTTSSLGTCPVTATEGYLWTVPAYNGGTRTFLFCYTLINWTTAFTGLTFDNISGSAYMLTGVVLPNGATWRFDYDSWGELEEVHTPTGGTISYAYTQSSDTCGNGYLVRTISSRTLTPYSGATAQVWNYSLTTSGASGLGITVVDSLNNKTVYTSSMYGGACTGAINSVAYYSNGSLLKTVATTFQYTTNPYAGDVGAMNGYYTLPTQVTTTWNNITPNQVSQTTQSYDSGFTFYDNNYAGPSYTAYYGLVLTKTQSDWGSPSAGGTLSTTTTNYEPLINSAYLSANLLDLPSSVIISGPSGKCSETDYAYDAGSPTHYSGAIQNNGITSSVRGNLTSTTKPIYSNPCQSSSPTQIASVTTSQTYYDTGMPLVFKDANLNQKTYGYSTSFYGAYVTSVTDGNFLWGYNYDFNTGLMTQLTDPNSAQTNYGPYDSMLRLEEVQYPANGGVEEASFNDTISYPSSPAYTYTRTINSAATFTQTHIVDGMGREITTKTTVPTSTCTAGYSYVATTYDGDGRKFSVSNPYCTMTDPTYGLTDTYYDALNRVHTVVEQDGSTVVSNYTGSYTQVTDEAGKMRGFYNNGLGQMTQMWEDPYGFDYPTYYAYDALGDLLSVVEDGGRQRTFNYDSLSRLTESINPESGTVCYAPSSSGSCGYLTASGYDGNGNLLTKTDARGITTSYSYDGHNRLTGKSYTDSTPAVSYSYDGTSPTNCSVGSFSYGSYPVTRRTAMCDAAGTEAWSYDAMGRALNDQRTTNSITETFTYGYNYDGSVASILYPSGHTITYSPTIISLPVSAVDSTSGINYATSSSYAPFGSLNSLSNGAYLLSTNYYNVRLQPCRIAVNNSGTAPTSCTDSTHKGNVLDFIYNFNTSSYLDNGNVAKITDNTSNTPNINYTYDSLNRIASDYTDATSGTCWGESFSIDAWGNMYAIAALSGYSACANESPSFTINSQNQIANTNFVYDLSGNMTNDGGVHSYGYDAESRIKTVGSSLNYYYDGDGKRVQKSSGTIYWYGLNDSPLLETNSSGGLMDEYIFFNGQRIARRDSSNNVEYYFGDHLGSTRVVTNSSGTAQETCYYYPYGASNCSPSSTNNYLFTGKERDSESGLDNFGARYDSSQYGRFMTPDPGNAGADPYNPQSWNMYSYVLNNPLSYTDPSGLDCVYLNDDESAGTVLRGDCKSSTDNGIFVNGTVDTTRGANLTGDRLSFNYTPDGSKTESIYNDEAPNPGLPASTDQMPIALNGQQMNPQNTPSMDQQRLAAVARGASMAGHVIPAPCGGGISVTAGRQAQKQDPSDPHAAMQAEAGYDLKGGLFLHNNNEAGRTNGGVGMSNGQGYAYLEDGEGEGLAVGEDGTVGAYVGHESRNGKFNFSFNAYVHITSVSGCHE